MAYLAREVKFRTMEERSWVVATATLYSVIMLKAEEVILLQVYLGKCDPRVKAEEIPLAVDVAWLVASIILGIEEKVAIIQTTRTSHNN